MADIVQQIHDVAFPISVSFDHFFVSLGIFDPKVLRLEAARKEEEYVG
jgi:hypothetical protein